MKLTEKQIEAIAKDCGFDVTGRLLKFANAVAAEAGPVSPAIEDERDTSRTAFYAALDTETKGKA